MPTTGELEEALRRAIREEDPDAAITAAHKIPYIGLGQALDLIRLLARKGDNRFGRFASRWVHRWVIAKGASSGEVMIAMAGMGALALDPDSEVAIEALYLVVRPDVPGDP